MATIQPPAERPSTPCRRAIRVYARRRWSDPWRSTLESGVDLSYLRVNYVVEALSPGISRAQLVWLVGRVQHEDQQEFAHSPPPDLTGWYVQIAELAPPPSEGTQDPGYEAETPIFTGWLPERGYQPRGDLVGETARADETYMAYGLELLLDRTPITTAAVDTGAAEFTTIARGVAWNEEDRRGPAAVSAQRVRGNRAAELRTILDETVGADLPAARYDTYGFAAGFDAEPWSTLDILRYLVAVHFPRGISWELELLPELEDFLRNDVPGVVHAEGRTVKQVLDEVLRRERGLAWRLEVGTDAASDAGTDEEAAVVKLRVFTLLDEPLQFASGARLPANGEVVDLMVDEALTAALSYTTDELARYSKIVVEGERIVACCSFSVAAGTLEAGWSVEQQQAYSVAAGGDDAAANDAARAQPALADVFQRFLVPEGWNRRGPGGASAAPTCRADGTIDADAEPAYLRPASRVGLRWLPVMREPTGEPLPPLVLIADADGRLVPIQGEGGPPSAVTVLDRGLGVRVEQSPNHKIAAGVELVGATATPPTHDYQTIVATIAYELDDRLRCELTIERGAEADALARQRVLTVRVPEAHAWYVAAGTVIGVDANGELLRHPGGVVRDDAPRLRHVMTAARALYGRSRATVGWTEHDADGGYAPGAFLRRLRHADGRYVDVCTVISQRTRDLQAWQATCTTEFIEIDLERVA